MSHPFDFARIATDPLPYGRGTAIVDGPADSLAVVHGYRGQASHDAAVALFTAAPAMLAALRELRQHIVHDPEGDLTRAEFDAMTARADAAIAAAENCA